MSQSQCMVELCALLVHETYGELASRIFTILLRRGRLPIPTLARHTRLTPKQLRHGLVVLVQQNLIYHHTDSVTGVTHYEANYNAAYALLRSGKIMSFVETRHGVLAREIVHNLLLLGHTKISDLLDAYEAQKKEQFRLAQLAREEAQRQQEEEQEEAAQSDENGDLNGVTEIRSDTQIPDPISASSGQIHTALARLFNAGLIERVVDSMFRSPADIQDELEKELARESSGGVRTAKQKIEIANRLKHKIRDLRREGTEWRPHPRKRPFNGDHANGVNGASKRRRLSSGAANGESNYEDDGSYLDADLVIRVNYEKCTVILRNAQLVELAKHKIGKTTSQIYAQFLNLLEPRLARCRPDIDSEEDSGPTATIEQIAATLDKNVDPGFGIGKLSSARADNVKVEKLHQPRKNGVSAPDVKDSGNINGYSNGVNGNGHAVNIDDHSEEEKTDQLLLDMFGDKALRMVRIFKKYGKIDEKALEKAALIKQKDVRTKLAEMQMAGIVEIQEVPKDANRNNGNTRTIFLWFYDCDRVLQVLVDRVLKAMSRLLQRLAHERRGAQTILELIERSDLRHADPEAYLEPHQYKDLQNIRRKEAMLMGQICFFVSECILYSFNTTS
ncbi:putative DNA-directed RNA polymerase III subunit RPC-3 [Glarea lozoyensis 74030]|uniref:DNA-directed RNA polymerase III subunit RPC3 n=1 Tax=Glarea lozoyensis (strain ATCC 74030 / MF5533) TaxID=1104152 RepID=H0ERQ0_GLAL7|nr:putative DNA-directed RNA polymerase III subunit RPC-3 [Glarea lozoyensis 74030]